MAVETRAENKFCEIREEVMELVRREAEQCDFFEDFIIQSNVMGGTGSGTCLKFNETLSVEYGKKMKL